MELEKLSIQELKKLISEKRKLIQTISKLDKQLNSPHTSSNYVIGSFDSNSKKNEEKKLIEIDDDDDNDSDDDDKYNAANFNIEKPYTIQRIIAHERFSNYFRDNKDACQEIFTQAPQESKSEVYIFFKYINQFIE